MATQPIPIYSQKETFYVPRFEVYVGGEELQADVAGDILQITYQDRINEIDSFSMEVNNWDPEQRKFKFVPPREGYEGVFDPGRKIEIRMGYYNNMRRMMRGLITDLELNFPESGASTLNVNGLNELHKFKTEQHTDSWIDGQKTDTDIAKDICRRPLQKDQTGLGLNIDAHPAPNEKARQVVYMKSRFDIVFLWELARRNGYEIYLEDEADTPTLFFGLSEISSLTPVYQLEWGKSLISFRSSLSTVEQVGEVVVRNWDRKSNQPIVGRYTLKELWKDEKKSQDEITSLSKIASAYDQRTEVVTDEPVHTATEACERARAILVEKNQRVIIGSGTTIGLPDLRSGCKVEIIGFSIKSNRNGSLQGASNIFDGEYVVESSTHIIGGNGYRTEFSARRTGDVGRSQDAP